MATTQKYLNHLLQNTGITPACSEEERSAAEDLARIFANHGFAPELQEFSASGSRKIVLAGLGVVAFLGAVLMGVGGAVGVVGLLLAIAAAVLYTMERTGRPVLSSFGAGGLSQNVIAYHKASGPLASPRNRPVVVVAHYDSPRADIFSRMPYASYRPVISKLLPIAMLVPAIVAVVRVLPLPDAAKTILWIVAIVVALVPLANAVAVFLNRFMLPYTSGSVCNKSSVASMLGVMDAVAPFERGEEFPEDTPFEEYYAEQQRIAAEQLAAAQQAANPDYSDYLDEEPAEAPGFDGGELEEPEQLEEPAAEDALEPVAAPTPAVDPLGSTVAMQMPPSLFDEGEEDGDVEQVEEPEAAFDESIEASAEGDAEPATDEVVVAEEPEPQDAGPVNAAGNYRFGADAIHALGMVPASTVLEYIEPEPPVAPAPAPAAPQPEEAPEVVEEVAQDDFDADKTGVFSAIEDDAPERIETEEVVDSYDEPAPRRPRPEIPYRPPVRHQPIQQVTPARSGIADALSSVREGAAHFFGTALQFGKDAVEKIESTARNLTGASEEEPYEDIAPEDVEMTEGYDETYEGGEELDAFEEDGPVAEYDEEYSEEDAVDQDDVEALDGEELEDEPVDETDAPAMEATAVFQPLSTHDGATQTGFSIVEDDADSLEDDGAADAEVASVFDEDLDDEGASPSPVAEESPTSPEEPQAEQAEVVDVYGDTQLFVMPPAGAPSATSTLVSTPASSPAMPEASRGPAAASEEETIDSLMAEINANRRPAPRPTRPAFSTVPDPARPSLNQTPVSSRASLFDLPDPSSAPVDPFVSEAPEERRVPTPPSVDDAPASEPEESPFETISAPSGNEPARPARSRGGLFRRKKQDESSMSDWLGVDESFDAKRTGGDIGSWDNFESDDWKGGATGVEGVTERELRDAITSMGDDELLGHDIWFVATGASEYDNAGMKAFLSTHRDKLRGVFLINLECVGAGQLAMVSTEGEERVLKGDKRITNLVRKVSAAFHNEFAAVEMPYETTDAYAAMSMSLRSLTIAGIDGPNFACSHSEADLPYNVNPENVDLVADVVTEVIRRS